MGTTQGHVAATSPDEMPAGQERLVAARRQVRAMTGFYVHLGIFALVMLLLVAIDAATGPGWWVHWPALGWGVGVLAYAAAVFGRAPAALRRWQQRKVDEIVRRGG